MNPPPKHVRNRLADSGEALISNRIRFHSSTMPVGAMSFNTAAAKIVARLVAKTESRATVPLLLTRQDSTELVEASWNRADSST